jgi:hypothetical protein
MTKVPGILTVLTALALAACSFASNGKPQHWIGKNAQGQEVLTAGCIPYQSASDCVAMRTVTITNQAVDEEFWIFEARVEVRANIGIPYGRMPRDFAVIGLQDRCESVRAEVAKTDTPTEACKGPFYFRRDKA